VFGTQTVLSGGAAADNLGNLGTRSFHRSVLTHFTRERLTKLSITTTNARQESSSKSRYVTDNHPGNDAMRWPWTGPLK
jgi:hypothetical protein